MQFKKFVGPVLLAGLSSCASLPTSGPTGRQIEKSAALSQAPSRIAMIDVAAASDIPVVPDAAPSPVLAEIAPPPTDMIGPGDVLDINIYEAGVTLFAGAGSAPGAAGVAAGNPGVQVQKLPPSRVDDNGDIAIPYAGRLHVGGRTVGDVETMIRGSLRKISQNPQVLITVSQAITNSVIVGGEVVHPGRLVLQTNRESLSDVIALAGGYRGKSSDLALRIARHGQNVDMRLNELVDDPQKDVRAYPGDRLTVLNSPRTFSVLGASGKVEQLPFNRSAVSLAEAVATAGGINPNLGDPAAIFLFRYVDNGHGGEEPVVYHLNMMTAGSYFLAQRFAMRDNDVLYFGNASANQPSKLLALVSQLFTPILTVTAAVQTLHNSR